MKVLALSASGRQGGNTQRLLGLTERNLRILCEGRGLTLDFECVRLPALNIDFCRGCRVCFDKGEDACPLRDDLPALYRKMLEADVLLAASPVYVEDIAARMKNVVDRLAFNSHRPAFAGKAALVLTTSGADTSGHAGKTLRFALESWGYRVAGVRNFRMGALMDDASASSAFGEQINLLCGKLLSAPDRAGAPPSFRQLMVFKIQQLAHQRADDDTCDGRYWREKGWLSPAATYCFPYRTKPVRTYLARLTGSVVARLFL